MNKDRNTLVMNIISIVEVGVNKIILLARPDFNLDSNSHKVENISHLKYKLTSSNHIFLILNLVIFSIVSYFSKIELLDI